MKGILLAGGTGSRLAPITQGISKQALPVFDKPMIYYPLTTLLELGIREIAIITNDRDPFERLFGDGSPLGIRLKYIRQPQPGGIAEALILAGPFIGTDECCLILGDNLFFHLDSADLTGWATSLYGAQIFALRNRYPSRYGVVEIRNGKAVTIEEKPKRPKSHFIVPGLYFYDQSAVEIAERLKPSERGELEISDVNRKYMEDGRLHVSVLHSKVQWFDAGTPEDLLLSSRYVQKMQKTFGKVFGCPEEAAYRKGYISRSALYRRSETYKNTEYGRYLNGLIYG